MELGFRRLTAAKASGTLELPEDRGPRNIVTFLQRSRSARRAAPGAAALLFACALATSAAPAFAIDQDRDGRPPGIGVGKDCDDRDPTVWNGAPDPSGDQFDQNCTDAVDADGDGYSTSTAPNGPRGDCDDRDADVNYGTGTCDSFSRPDIDDDGYLRPFILASGLFDYGADCNDGRRAARPGASETGGNGIDDDCDGAGFNVVRNGSFEISRGGWAGSNASLMRVGGAAEGAEALRVALNNSGGAFAAYTSDRPIRAAAARVRYIAWAYIRSDKPGKKVYLRVRHISPTGSTLRTVTTSATTTSGWRKLTAAAFQASRRGGTVEVRIFQWRAVSGDNFEVDQVTLSRTPLLTCDPNRRWTGTADGDARRGSRWGDRMYGRGGDDRVDGRAANDCLFGGDGPDHLVGGSGHDRVFGDDDADTLLGGYGRDRLAGGAGTDRLAGGAKADVLLGGTEGDRLSGGYGDDRLWGQGGGDTIYGGRGNDRVRGGDGNDVIVTWRDGVRDRVYCGPGRDRVFAGRNDVLAGCEVVRR